MLAPVAYARRGGLGVEASVFEADEAARSAASSKRRVTAKR
jgi:hypothetical protein